MDWGRKSEATWIEEEMSHISSYLHIEEVPNVEIPPETPQTFLTESYLLYLSQNNPNLINVSFDQAPSPQV